MRNAQCKWVRDRLPLLAGNDLLGSERRRVERHLIGCPHCRGRKEALESAFGVLQATAGEPLVNPDAPSLWPALARQIREARRPAGVRSIDFSWLFAWSRLRPLPTFSLSLMLVFALGLTLVVRHRISVSRAEIAEASRPTKLPAVGSSQPSDPSELLGMTPKPVETESEAASSSPLHYDLEHGTPMGPDAPLESKSKLTH